MKIHLLLILPLVACVAPVSDGGSMSYGTTPPMTSDGGSPPPDESLPEGCFNEHLKDGQNILMCVPRPLKPWEFIPDPLLEVESVKQEPKTK